MARIVPMRAREPRSMAILAHERILAVLRREEAEARQLALDAMARVRHEVRRPDTYLRIMPGDQASITRRSRAPLQAAPAELSSTCAVCFDAVLTDKEGFAPCSARPSARLCWSCVSRAVLARMSHDQPLDMPCLLHFKYECNAHALSFRDFVASVPVLAADAAIVRAVRVHEDCHAAAAFALQYPCALHVACPRCDDPGASCLVAFAHLAVAKCARCNGRFCAACNAGYEPGGAVVAEKKTSFVAARAGLFFPTRWVPAEHAACLRPRSVRSIVARLRLPGDPLNRGVPARLPVRFDAPQPLRAPPAAELRLARWAWRVLSASLRRWKLTLNLETAFPRALELSVSDARRAVSQCLSRDPARLFACADHLLHALFRFAQTSSCARCGMTGRKNDACSHVTCCGRQWCYMCGDTVRLEGAAAAASASVHGCPVYLERGGLSPADPTVLSPSRALEVFHHVKHAVVVHALIGCLGLPAALVALRTHAAWGAWWKSHGHWAFVVMPGGRECVRAFHAAGASHVLGFTNS